MALQRGMDGPDPAVRREPIEHLELRRSHRSGSLGAGTLACPRCDAPVALGAGHVGPADPLGCPFCMHWGAVRDFLSMAAPARPARVEVRVRLT